uniref:Uncharacterized protein n=1 Tax=Oryza sativa subsp. japonica TaxID=39947 RepID=Q5Z903_ORYSJ|nr:hypothetical protein [Oryza sativa Japonica Group]
MDAGRRAPTPTRLRKSENQVDARVYLCGGEGADEATAMRAVRTCVPRLQRRTGGDSAGGIAAAAAAAARKG